MLKAHNCFHSLIMNDIKGYLTLTLYRERLSVYSFIIGPLYIKKLIAAMTNLSYTDVLSASKFQTLNSQRVKEKYNDCRRIQPRSK